MPIALQVVFESRAITVFARTILASFFLIAGLFGLVAFDAVAEEMRAVSLPAPHLFAAATILTQVIGAFLLISNIRGLASLGAGMLGVFTLLCIPIAHPFWADDAARRTADLQIALEHVALTGGLLLAAIQAVRAEPRTEAVRSRIA